MIGQQLEQSWLDELIASLRTVFRQGCDREVNCWVPHASNWLKTWAIHQSRHGPNPGTGPNLATDWISDSITPDLGNPVFVEPFYITTGCIAERSIQTGPLCSRTAPNPVLLPGCIRAAATIRISLATGAVNHPVLRPRMR